MINDETFVNYYDFLKKKNETILENYQRLFLNYPNIDKFNILLVAGATKVP